MQVIIKPLGMIAILAALSVLGVLAYQASRQPDGENPPPVETPAAPPATVAAGWNFAKTETGDGTMAQVTASGAPSFTQALRLTVTKADPKSAWAVQANHNFPFAVAADRNLAVRFWARSATKGKALVVIEEAKEPYFHELTLDQALTADWKQYTAPFRTAHAYQTNALHVGLQVGREKGTYEFGPVELIDAATGKPVAP